MFLEPDGERWRRYLAVSCIPVWNCNEGDPQGIAETGQVLWDLQQCGTSLVGS